MKKFILTISILLSGCVATPVARHFPEAPEELKVTCPDLQKVQQGAKLSDVVTTVTTNYGQYQECQVKVDTWNEWYTKQKQIFDSVK